MGIGLGYFPVPTGVPVPVECILDPDCGLYGPCLLEGALQYVIDWAVANPTHVNELVLVTDGEPTGCSHNTLAAAGGTEVLPARRHVGDRRHLPLFRDL